MSAAGTLDSYEHDGFTFDVIDGGPRDGDIVVLLHGFPERAATWNDVAIRLHGQGFRTLAPDQRGYSPGARPRRRRDYALGLLVGDVVALIEAAGGDPVHVVGHDWGAAVAWGVAASRPDLVRTLTAFSVPHPGAFARSMLTSGQALKSWYMAAFQLPWLPERLCASTRADTWLAAGGMTSAEVERYRTHIVADGALRGGLGWYRAIPFGNGGLFASKVTVPTTMVWSDGDRFLGRAGCEASERYVAAEFELVVLAGVNHFIPSQAPASAAEVIVERTLST